MGSERMSILDFARFWVGSGTQQIKIIKQYIKEKEDDFFALYYYREARSIITQYHNEYCSDDWLHAQAQELLATANEAEKPRAGSRLRKNYKAVIDYLYNDFRKRELKIITGKKMKLRLDMLFVTGVADLVAIENGTVLYIKLDFSGGSKKVEYIKTILSCMHWAYYRGRLPLGLASFQYWNISNGKGVLAEEVGIISIDELNRMASHISEMRKNILAV